MFYNYNGENFYKRINDLWEQKEKQSPENKRKKFTGENFGKAIGVEKTYLSKWKHGTMPSIENLVRIANYFDITLEELLDIELDKNKTDKTNDTTLDLYNVLKEFFRFYVYNDLRTFCAYENPFPVNMYPYRIKLDYKREPTRINGESTAISEGTISFQGIFKYPKDDEDTFGFYYAFQRLFEKCINVLNDYSTESPEYKLSLIDTHLKKELLNNRYDA